MKIANILVDYDNVTEKSERSPADVALNVPSLLNKLTFHLESLIPHCEELHVRFYGGWLTRGNQFTDRAVWLLAELPKFRRRIGSVRVKPSLTTSLTVRPDLTLIGTYQADQQKMVDEMITADAIQLAHSSHASLAIVSDDDDFVPAVIAACSNKTISEPLYLLRRHRKIGDSPNDPVLQFCHVRLSIY